MAPVPLLSLFPSCLPAFLGLRQHELNKDQQSGSASRGPDCRQLSGLWQLLSTPLGTGQGPPCHSNIQERNLGF